MLTGDFDQLAVAVRPFRAIHHLREAIILNATLRELPADYVKAVKDKFGTEIKRIDRDQVLDAYNAVDDGAAEAETKRWMDGAEKVVEPSREEVFRSCKLALAFEKLLNDADATVITVECYGSMYRQLPAFPCIGFTRLNDMGLGGICESDLSSAMTFVLLQSLSGKPGFISDPTVDESTGSIILAHCLGSTRMDGPQGEVCPYKLRCIMERQEGAVAQVRMRLNQKVTQAELIGTDRLQYFTGEIIEVPDIDRGCRTKITVKVDGDIDSLWKNWSHGLHRVTCYGDVTKDLKRFCRFKGIQMIDEAQPAPEPLT
jgi:L-fucose isomerase-like protein